MEVFGLISLGYVLYLEAKMLQKGAAKLYAEKFQHEPWVWGLGAALVFAAIPAFYWRRRGAYFKSLRVDARHLVSQEYFQPQKAPGALENSDESVVEKTPPVLENHAPGEKGPAALPSLEERVQATGICIVWGYVTFWGFLFLRSPIFSSVIDTHPLEVALIGSVGTMVLLLALIYRVSIRRDGGFLSAVGLVRRGQPLKELVFVPIGIGMVMAVVISLAAIQRPVLPQTPLEELLQSSRSPLGLGAFLVMAIIFGPMMEEMIFRGYFFAALQKAKGSWFAVWMTAAIFGLLHVPQYWGDWFVIGAIGFLGILLGGVRLWSRSTIASACLHYAYNGFSIIVPVIFLMSTQPSYVQYRMRYDELTVLEREELLLKSIAEAPRQADAYNDLAWIYATEKKNLMQARDLIAQALDLRPQTSAYLDTQAEVFFQSGDCRTALALEEKLCQKYPQEAVFRGQLEKFRRECAEDINQKPPQK